MKRQFNDRKGFTLIELLISVTLLAIGLLAMASMQGIALSANSISNRMTFSASLAQTVAEDLLARPNAWGQLRLTSDGGPFFDIDIDPDPLVTSPNVTIPNAGRFEASYTVDADTQVEGATVIGLTRIDITVRRMEWDATTGTRNDLSSTGNITGTRNDYILSCYKNP